MTIGLALIAASLVKDFHFYSYKWKWLTIKADKSVNKCRYLVRFHFPLIIWMQGYGRVRMVWHCSNLVQLKSTGTAQFRPLEEHFSTQGLSQNQNMLLFSVQGANASEQPMCFEFWYQASGSYANVFKTPGWTKPGQMDSLQGKY